MEAGLLVDGNRGLADEPFEPREIPNVCQVRDTSSKEVREITAVFRNARSLGWTFANEAFGGVGDHRVPSSQCVAGNLVSSESVRLA